MATAKLEPLFDQLVSRDVPLQDLYLDPNNPRFVDLHSEYVPDDRVPDPVVQETALSILNSRFGLDRLRLSISVNGYLPVDRIIVRDIGGGKYVVLEGNRRIAAAKTIPQFTESGVAVDEKVLTSVATIPVLVYVGDEPEAAWLFQGIRHILGINDWSAYNKARLLVEQMARENLTLSVAGQRFGTSAQGAGQWVRSYKAFDQARSETDFAAEVDERLYPFIQELFGRSSTAMKDWLSWDEKEQRFTSADRFEEFVSWFYPKGEIPDDADPADFKGDWEKRRITNRDDIRKIGHLIGRAPKRFQEFRDGADFEQAYGQALVDQYEQQRELDVDREKKIVAAVRKCSQELRDIPLAVVRNEEEFARIRLELQALKDAMDFVLND
jgi:hypothetical protein